MATENVGNVAADLRWLDWLDEVLRQQPRASGDSYRRPNIDERRARLYTVAEPPYNHEKRPGLLRWYHPAIMLGPVKRFCAIAAVLGTVVLGVAESLTAQTTGIQASGYDGPRTPDGKPDLNGIWQVLGTAAWDIRAHNAQDGVPAGLGVVEGGEIPYQPWASVQQRENYANRMNEDPARRCFLPGVPRITYMPFPFRLMQTADHVVMTYEFAHTVRIIYTDGSPHPLPNDFWMGDSRGHWEGDTLVVDTTHFNGQTWFDAAGNFHSDALHVVERYTPTSSFHIDYQVRVEDETVFTRPWTMRMPLYRRMEEGLQLLDYDCVDFVLQSVTAQEGGSQ